MISKFVFQKIGMEWHIFKKDEKAHTVYCLCGKAFDFSETLKTSHTIKGDTEAQILACQKALNVCPTCVRELFLNTPELFEVSLDSSKAISAKHL